VLFVLLLVSCTPDKKTLTTDRSLTEFSDYFTKPTREPLYSQHVQDTFTLFKAIPQGYSNDSASAYPLIIVLDANAFFESTVSELKFNAFIGLIPKSIVIGIGYHDFQAMDSLRSRDYTYPAAIPEYEMSLSGGAENFKNFIDQELIPKLTREYKINMDESVLCGHSLGGYFALFYGLRSMEENAYKLKHIVAASPSLHYNHRYLFDRERNLGKPSNEVPLSIYISMGSEDMADEESKGILDSFADQLGNRNYKGLKIKKAVYSNFGHIDAAIPGFIKGLTYSFEE
jgi:predicted alpha/beta superfamily hydrolase